MKISKYIMDKILIIFLMGFGYFIILMMLIAFKTSSSLTIAITLVLLVVTISIFIIDYTKRKKFYQQLYLNMDRLKEKYLVLETLEKPSFYEGDLFYQSLYEINKSMIENVKEYEYSVNDFKEYIEMWIHEVKIPISSLVLMCHNHKDKIDKNYADQVRRLDNYIDQVLYYVRSENAEKDYLIKEITLDKVISKVALKNKDDLLENKINFNVKDMDVEVLTDSKWLEFILNQIINNSIKYKKDDVDSCINIYSSVDKNKIVLNIYDNGIGINETDLPQVFKKTFTGINGRNRSKSTGMGLYIAKKLCTKLGHLIEIQSVSGEYTKVMIVFSKNDFYKMK